MGITKSRSLMGKDKFERFVYEQFADHQINLNTGEVWQAVEEHLPRKNSGFPLLGMLLGIILLAFIFFGLYLAYSGPWSAVVSGKTAEMSQASEALKLDEEGNVSSGTHLNAQNLDEGVAVKNHTVDGESLSTSEEVEQNNVLKSIQGQMTNQPTLTENGQSVQSLTKISSGVMSDDHDAKSSKNRDNLKSTTKFGGVEDNTKSASSIEKSSLGVGQGNRVDNTSSLSENRSLDSKASSSKKLSAVVENSSPSPQGYEDSKLGLTVKSIDDVLEVSEKRHVVVVNKLNRRVDELLALEENTTFTLFLPSLNDCYSFANRSLAIALDIYAGASYAQRSLSAANGSDPENYIESRNSTERFLESFDAGVAINFIHRKGFMAGVGVNYRQIDEEFNFIQNSTETKFDSVIARIEIDSTGSQDTIKEWRPISFDRRRELITYNYYRMVDIPISVGYQFHRGLWTIEGTAGLSFNVLTKQEGEILDYEGNLNDLKKNKLLKDRIGVSFFGGVKLLYPISNRLSVFAEPYVHINLKDISVDGYELEQKYNSYGLRLGGRVIF